MGNGIPQHRQIRLRDDLEQAQIRIGGAGTPRNETDTRKNNQRTPDCFTSANSIAARASCCHGLESTNVPVHDCPFVDLGLVCGADRGGSVFGGGQIALPPNSQ